MNRATMNAAALAELLGYSTWTIYQSVKAGTCPVEPIRIGRRLVWSTAKVAELLGVDAGDLYKVPGTATAPLVTTEDVTTTGAISVSTKTEEAPA
jgi:predicted DNA-binding transcriptional regulator AlpA